MMRSRFLPIALALAPALLLGGCSQGDTASNAPGPEQAQAAKPAEPGQQLDTYRQLLRIGNDEMAVTIGKDIQARFPDSAAAREVGQSLPAIEKRYTEHHETNRLKALWLYQTSPMEGGTQSTATIYSSQPAGSQAVRLVLRRHTSWGQSVFLFGSGSGFVCKGNCTLQARFDGKSHPLKGFLPTTGEPAIFIRDDAGFIAALRKAHKISISVELKDGGPTELVYEVGGFEAAHWAAVGKQKHT